VEVERVSCGQGQGGVATDHTYAPTPYHLTTVQYSTIENLRWDTVIKKNRDQSRSRDVRPAVACCAYFRDGATDINMDRALLRTDSVLGRS
jgi:hypothetical protein